VAGSEPVSPDDVVSDEDEYSEGGGSSVLGQPGVSWRGDGALGAGRAQLRDMDPDQMRFLPAVDEQSGYPLATFGRRSVGILIDELIIVGLTLLMLPALMSVGSDDPRVMFGQAVLARDLLRIGYGLIFNPRGWSPGKRLMGLRIVRLDGEQPGARSGVVRTAAAVISLNLFLIGYVWAAFDAKTQTWHDRLSGTYVVHVDQGIEGETHTRW
jgi:uncharacterized RDD family membrane protein YckC